MNSPRLPTHCPLCHSQLQIIDGEFACPKTIIAKESKNKFNEYYFYNQILDNEDYSYEKFMFPEFEINNFFDSVEIYNYASGLMVNISYSLDISKFNTEDKIRKFLCLI